MEKRPGRFFYYEYEAAAVAFPRPALPSTLLGNKNAKARRRIVMFGVHLSAHLAQQMFVFGSP